MNAPHCHETTLLRRQLDNAERELNHRAEIITEQADVIAGLRMDLAVSRVDVKVCDASVTIPNLPTRARSTCFVAPEDEHDYPDDGS